MISIKVSYEQCLKDYPEVVEEFLTSLKESNSCSKHIALEKIKWFYSWGKFNKKSRSEEERTLSNINMQNRMSMTYDQRLPVEMERVRVNITMEAGEYLRGDRVPKTAELSEFVIRYENELLKVQMLQEQKEFNDAHILNSIPEPNKEILDELVPPEVREMQEKMQAALDKGEVKNTPKRTAIPSFDVDDLLDKISDTGMESLSDEEKAFLKNQSNK